MRAAAPDIMAVSTLSAPSDTRQVTVLTNGRDLVLGWDGLQDSPGSRSWEPVFDALAARSGWQGPPASLRWREQTARVLDRITAPGGDLESPAAESWRWLVVTADQVRTVPGTHPPVLPVEEGPALVLGVGRRRFVEMDAADSEPAAQRMTAWAHRQYGLLRLAASPDTVLANPPPDAAGAMTVLPVPRYHMVGIQHTGQQGAYTVLDRWAPTSFPDQARNLMAEWYQHQPGNPALERVLQRSHTQLTPLTQQGSTWDVFARPLTSVGAGPFPTDAADWHQHPAVQNVMHTEYSRFLHSAPAVKPMSSPPPVQNPVHPIKL